MKIDLAWGCHDDYPAMVLRAGPTTSASSPSVTLRGSSPVRLEEERWPLNTSGGQDSLRGQAGAAGGMHGLVEAVRPAPRRGRCAPSARRHGWPP